MKRFALALCLLTLLFFTLAAARQPQQTSEQAAVRAAVTNYIEAYYTGDFSRMEKSLHPHYLKHTISGPAGKSKMTEKTGLQMVHDVRSAGPINLAKWKGEWKIVSVVLRENE